MKGINLCGECGAYDWKKHRCNRGAAKDTDPRASFYADCPLPEVEIVRHGRWKSVGLSSLKCSRCGYIDDYKMHYKGCPECRAKMDGGANE